MNIHRVPVNGEVSVSYINHFNVQNMRQTIKLTPLFCNLVPSLLYIRILSIHFFSKFPKNCCVTFFLDFVTFFYMFSQS
jgi:hypothetical protein